MTTRPLVTTPIPLLPLRFRPCAAFACAPILSTSIPYSNKTAPKYFLLQLPLPNSNQNLLCPANT